MGINEEDIKRFLIDELNLDASDVDKECMLFSTGILDSFSMISLISFLEKKLVIRIKPTEFTLENFDSISRMLDFLENR
jgi:acyl carrier protein